MHLRRTLLLLALVLGLTAIAASVAPPPAEDDRPSGAQAPPPPTETADPGEQRAGFRSPPPGRKPVTRRVTAGQPLAVFVSASAPGQATIPKLGRVASVTPEDPARFDLLLSDPASYDVRFIPADGGEARRLGKLVVRSAG